VKDKLPLTPPALAALGVLLLVIVGGYFGLIAPRRSAVARLEAQLAAGPAVPASAVSEPPISDEEREAWTLTQAEVRARFASPDDQHRTVVEVGQLARSTGLRVRELLLDDQGTGPVSAAGAPVPAAATSTASLPFPLPPQLMPNNGSIRLIARHRYRELIDFLNRLGRGNTYVAVQSLDVRRIDGGLESEIRLVSFRWTE
jgi:hypothetical protein